MDSLIAFIIFFVLFFIIPKGRKVLVIFLGLIYIPFQMLFAWLQAFHAGLKEKGLIWYILAAFIVYPLYAIIILYSQFYEKLHSTMKE